MKGQNCIFGFFESVEPEIWRRPVKLLEPLKPLDLRDPGALNPLILGHWSPERGFIPWTLSLWILGTTDLAFAWDMDPAQNHRVHES